MLTVPTVPHPVFHQTVRTRLGLLLYVGEQSFSQLKAALSMTDGNLDAHLRKLASAGFLHSEMRLKQRPHTVYCLSSSGREAFQEYIEFLGAINAIAVSADAEAKAP